MSPKSAKLGLRHGFTLIELLIVIAVIGMLMSLTIVVMNGISDRAMRAATKATVQKINGLLQQRIEAFDRAFTDDRREDAIQHVRDILEPEIILAKGAPHSLENESATSVLAKKLEFRFQFPQRVQDRLDAPNNRDPQATGAGLTATNLPTSLYEVIAFPVARTQLIEKTGGTPTVAQVNAQVNVNWAKHDRDTESAELLYFALVRSESFGATVSGADQFSASEISDTDNDGLPEFVDAWGNPLRFYRWPTRLVDHNPPVPFNPILSNLADGTDGRVITADERRVAGVLLKGLPPAPGTISGTQQREHLLVDPDDPIGLLYTFLENPQYIAMGIDLQDYINEDTFHTIDTYHTPLIVSAGADENLGLYEPWFTDTGIFGTLAQPVGVVLPAVPVYPLAGEDAMLDNVTNRSRRAGGQL
ncbi:MAG: type II secretion system GspH family protein [Fuerstiella sp.]|nr:type II secretion system GspH family protein [Fuerstiella sp.]